MEHAASGRAVSAFDFDFKPPARARRGQDLGPGSDEFALVYEHFRPALLSFCRHILGNAEEAEDAVQQTFLSAYSSLRAGRRCTNLRPWLYTIAHNQCIDLIRRRRRELPGEALEIETESLPETVERREELRQLLGDVDRLPPVQRKAFVFSSLQARPHDEIADELDCDRGKVKSLVHQAHVSLEQRRQAREASCSEIRAQLTSLRGGALRRGLIVRHLEYCPGCREFSVDAARLRRGRTGVPLAAGVAIFLTAAAAGAIGGLGTHGNAGIERRTGNELELRQPFHQPEWPESLLQPRQRGTRYVAPLQGSAARGGGAFGLGRTAARNRDDGRSARGPAHELAIRGGGTGGQGNPGGGNPGAFTGGPGGAGGPGLAGGGAGPAGGRGGAGDGGAAGPPGKGTKDGGAPGASGKGAKGHGGAVARSQPGGHAHGHGGK